MNQRFGVMLAVLVMAFGPSAYAFDFARADALFALRDHNHQKIAEARAEYEAALPRTSGKDLQYAVQQLGKLAQYEGTVLTPETDTDSRKAIFKQCRDYVEKIHPRTVGPNAVYYYFKSVCLAQWGKAAGSIPAFGKIGELQTALEEGLKFGTDYEHGGMHRVVAAIYVRSKGIFPIMYNPGYGLTQINLAISKGPQYYNAYLIKAEALEALGQRQKAIELLETYIGEIEKSAPKNLPKGLEPETMGVLDQMKQFLASID